MSKGSRKRSNTKSSDKKKEFNKKQKNAVADLQAINPVQNIFKDFPVRAMNTDDSNRVKEMFTLSNNLVALQKKYADTQLQIRFSKKFIKQLKSGEVKGPLMIRVSPTLFMPLNDMEKAITSIKSEIEMLEETNKITRGQLEHRYEEYVDSLIMINREFTRLVGDKHLTTLSGRRGKEDTQKDEEVIFEKEFNDEMKKEELEAIPKEVKRAIEEDKAKKEKVKKSEIEQVADDLNKKE